LTCATLCFREIKVSPKIRVLPSGTLFQTGFRKFRHGTPMVGKCDISCDRRQTSVYGTSGNDGLMADMHGMYGMAQTSLA